MSSLFNILLYITCKSTPRQHVFRYAGICRQRTKDPLKQLPGNNRPDH